MQFSRLISAIAALAGVAAAVNTIEFVNQDSTTRTIVFTPNAGLEEIAPLKIKGYGVVVQEFSDNWVGNFWAMSEGAAWKPGMLGEIAWNSWKGTTFFDVSSIVNPDDKHGVKLMFPKNSQLPTSGCQSFPCDNAYNVWNDDVQTKSTKEDTIICLLGKQGLLSRDNETKRHHARHMAVHKA